MSEHWSVQTGSRAPHANERRGIVPTKTWEEASDYVDLYFEYIFGLDNAQDTILWTYIISVAVHLELFATRIL